MSLFKDLQKSRGLKVKERYSLFNVRLSQSQHKQLADLAFKLRSSKNWVLSELIRITHEQMKKS